MQDSSDFPAAVPPLRLNALAPDFTARTTMGERSLSDYRGRWLVRAISWYPMTVGRSVDELLRLVTALQVTDREQASAPAGWTTGAPLMEPAAVTLDEALATEAGGQGWYTRERRS